jgi:uncharacterized protein YbjT (DUF2867 family)
MTVLIFGATGLIGEQLLGLCLANPKINLVKVVVRKELSIKHAKLKQYVGTYESFDKYADGLQANVVFNCLGTTLKVAGSKEAQYQIDALYPIKAANVAKNYGAKTMVSVSSVGTTPGNNFYLNTKADMEAGVQKAFGYKAYFMRPSFLQGKRKEFRLGEKIGIFLMLGLNYILLGSLAKWKMIDSALVAKAMLQIAFQEPSQTVFEYSNIVTLAKQYDTSLM